jgi:anti-sigma-K factor RsiG
MRRGTIQFMVSLESELTRLLSPDYLDEVKERSLEEVRTMRAECQEAETAVSYLRRMAQGRLDIVHAYLDAGEDDGVGGLDSLVERLPEIISSGPQRPAGYGRLPSQMSPDMESEFASEIDKVLDTERIANLPTMKREELLELAERLSAIESRSSNERRALHERIDKLQAEIVSRYKTGEASVEGLLA